MLSFAECFNDLLTAEGILRNNPSAEVLIEDRPQYGWTDDQAEKYDKKRSEVESLRK